MARPKIGDKPREIRDATVAEVAAKGSTAVSVNKIAERAGLSIGTIYRYHRTKEDLLLSVFLDIKRDIHAAMMGAAANQTGAADRLRAMWFALVDYGFAAPADFQLVEMLSAEVRPVLKKQDTLEKIRAEILAEIQNGIDQNVLVDAPVRQIETVLASPSITLARRAYLSGVRPDKEELTQIFGLVWRGISRAR